MNFLSRLPIFLFMSISLAEPATAGVPLADTNGFCDVITADGDKKPDDTEPEGEEEPDCD